VNALEIPVFTNITQLASEVGQRLLENR